MPIFTLRELEIDVKKVRRIFLLEVDGKSPFADFEKRMTKAGKRNDLSKIGVLLEDLALGLDLPNNANAPLRGVDHEDEWKEYELRKNQLRVYYFLIPPNSNVIVLGEFKKAKKDNKEQKETIAEFRRLKQAFKLFYTTKYEEE